MSLKDDQNKIRASEAKKTRTRGRQFTVGGNKFIEGQTRELRDKTKVITRREFFGNYNTGVGTFYATRVSDGKKMKVRPDDFKPAKAGAPSFVETERSGTKRPSNRFLNKQNIESNRLAEKIRLGEIKTNLQLKNDPDYKRIQSPEIKNKLVKVLVAKGGDASYKPVEKKVELPKPEPKQISVKDKYEQQIKDQKSMSPQRYYQVYKQPLTATVTKPRSTVDRATTSAASGARNVIRGKGGFGRNILKRFASGGMVNARNGAFIEVQNNFSDRILPGKKRTTRIY